MTTIPHFKSKNTTTRRIAVATLFFYIFAILVASFLGILFGLLDKNLLILVSSTIIFGLVLWFLLKDTILKRRK